MTISPESVSFDEDSLTVALSDGRKISAPLAWFPRLLHAAPEQLAQVELSRHGCSLCRVPGVRARLTPVAWSVGRRRPRPVAESV